MHWVRQHLLLHEFAISFQNWTSVDSCSTRSRQILAISNTSTSVLTQLLENEGTSMPAFQTFFVYVLLNLIYTSYTIYRYGFKGWLRMVYRDGWKCKAPSLHSYWQHWTTYVAMPMPKCHGNWSPLTFSIQILCRSPIRLL
jgi:Solute carrier family 35